jgi:hypothetical protein
LEVAPPSDEGWGGRFVTLEDPNRYRLFFVTWHEERPQPKSGGLSLPD